MKSTASMNAWRLIAILGIAIGLYPLLYLLPGISVPGFMEQKGGLVNDPLWSTAFYMHIIGRGIALVIGWLQFWKSFRDNNIRLHRSIGFV